VRIARGSKEKLVLGNMEIYRDWGWAPDYVEAMWIMLQQGKPDDYVIATGREHSLRDFVREVFGRLGLDWEEHMATDPSFFRPSDITRSCGNAAKARKKLGWRARHAFPQVVKLLVEAELAGK
jgi:GDPmannose 4,6-dehydratase